jgi:hypothetical protein
MAGQHPSVDTLLSALAHEEEHAYGRFAPKVIMDNSGDGPIKAPGFNGCPINFEQDYREKQRFSHGASDWKQ